MKRNTYVTAALFVVFGMLTVAYWNMEEAGVQEGPITMSLSELEVQSTAEIVDAREEEEETEETMADSENEEDGEEEAESTLADADENEEEEETTEVMSSIQVVRSEVERQRSQQVASLTEIIASADFDAETKSAAKDSLNAIERLNNSGRALETVIGTMGFSDVLVRASEEFVQVTIQVDDLDVVPSREELAELYVLAGFEFVNHRNGNISIDFQPLN